MIAPVDSTDSDTATVVFTPSGRRGSFPMGTTVLSAARRLGVDLDSVCGGRGLCGRCQVMPGVGDFPKFAIKSRKENLSSVGVIEQRYKDKRGLAERRRLGCSVTIQGDMVIDVPPDSQVHKQVVRKRAEVRDIELDPLVRLCCVAVPEPDMDNPSGDLERLKQALVEQWQVAFTDADLSVLQGLQQALRDGKWTVTAAIRHDGTLVKVWTGFHDRMLGLAVDVGSTTLSAHLCDLRTGEVLASAGAMNPQIRFGEDLMSRVSWATMNPGGAVEMTAAVREALNTLALETITEAGADPNDVLEMVLVGNPVMHHLLLGLDPKELGWAPFALTTSHAVSLRARELNLTAMPAAHAYIPPCVAGHVGADAAAVVLSEAPHKRQDITLIVDVGTNAEIVLGNKERLLACSSPTGPALEGAQISCGQRAAPGAVERVRIDPETLEPRFRIIGCDLWSNEEGFAEATATTGMTGICGSGIIEVMAEMFLCGLLTADGVINGDMADRTRRIVPEGRTFSYVLYEGGGGQRPELRITQADVRAIQLAKGALYAGAQLLVDRLGRPPERIVLAGAFGSHIDPKYAMILGLIPDCPLDHVQSAGNAAGTGARIALLNRAARAEIEEVVTRIEKIETATETRFQDHFVEAMAFPHKTATYTELRKTVKLPESVVTGKGEVSKKKRRNRRRG